MLLWEELRTRFSGVPLVLCVTLERALPSLGRGVLICTKWRQTRLLSEAPPCSDSQPLFPSPFHPKPLRAADGLKGRPIHELLKVVRKFSHWRGRPGGH